MLYVCDGIKPDCPKDYCKWLGKGECAHTSDVEHARYDDHDDLMLVPMETADGGKVELVERVRV